MNLKSVNHRIILPSLLLIVIGLAGCMPPQPKLIERIKDIEYADVGGDRLLLDVYRPRHFEHPLPVILWLYGGAWKAGNKYPCPIAFIAAQQVEVVSINYRLTSVAPFPAQIYDCKGAVRWIRSHAAQYGFDPGHIGVFGVSAGGHLAALLGTTAGNPELEGNVGGNRNYSSRVECVCAFYPPTDLNRLVDDPRDRIDPNGDVAKLLGGPVADNVAKANFASPVFYADKNSAPFFLMHGGSDQLVPPEQSAELYSALKKAGVEVHLEIIPHEGHGIIAPPKVANEIFEFFQAHLGVKPRAAIQG